MENETIANLALLEQATSLESMASTNLRLVSRSSSTVEVVSDQLQLSIWRRREGTERELPSFYIASVPS